ncbi:MAG: IS630 transposase-related protein [Planctomycetota bacterium]
MAHSMDIRRKVIAALERGESAPSIAKRLEIGERTVYDYKKRHAANRLAPDKPGPQGPIKLTEDDLRTLATAVQRQPDLTLDALAAKMSVPVDASTISRTLKKLRLTLKKSR